MKLTKVVSPTKKRRHHNNKGYARIKRGAVTQQVADMAEKLGIPHPHKLYSSQKKRNVLYF